MCFCKENTSPSVAVGALLTVRMCCRRYVEYGGCAVLPLTKLALVHHLASCLLQAHVEMAGEWSVFQPLAQRELRLHSPTEVALLSFPSAVIPTTRIPLPPFFQLMAPNPEDRLGCGPGGTEAVKAHPWFAALDWRQLATLHLPTPPDLVKRIDSAQKLRASQVEERGISSEVSYIQENVDLIEMTNELGGPLEANWFEGW